MVLVKQKALHTFGACNRSTHPGNKQEFFFSFKSRFSLIISASTGPNFCKAQTRFPLLSMAGCRSAHSAVSAVTKGKMLPKYPRLEWVSYGSSIPLGPVQPCCLPPHPGADDDAGALVSSPVGTPIFNSLSHFLPWRAAFFPAAPSEPCHPLSGSHLRSPLPWAGLEKDQALTSCSAAASGESVSHRVTAFPREGGSPLEALGC